MKNPVVRLVFPLMLAGAVAGLAPGCASRRVSVAEMSAPARAAAERVTAGGTIEKIDKERERGKVVYDVEATVGGKHAEFAIADADGEVLGRETQIEFNELPEAARAAVENYFGTITGLTVMKCVEYGQTEYEIEGAKGGKRAEITFDAAGKRR